MAIQWLLKAGGAKIHCLFYALFVYALLVSLAYLATVIIGALSGQGSLYSSVTIVIFIISCIGIIISVFFEIRLKITSSIVFFIFLIDASYRDPLVNAIFRSDNEGWKLLINLAFFLLGYILPALGVVVGARLLMLSQYGKGGHASERTEVSR